MYKIFISHLLQDLYFWSAEITGTFDNVEENAYLEKKQHSPFLLTLLEKNTVKHMWLSFAP